MARTILLVCAALTGASLAPPAHADPACVIVTVDNGQPISACADTPFVALCDFFTTGVGAHVVTLTVCAPQPLSPQHR
ncbi:MAG: hypothetical protein QOE45_2155 [Frankiaceae bacterium]|jgi:hypothetical protein|nr:hypothetical protein [Frankiaceae bacterium]